MEVTHHTPRGALAVVVFSILIRSLSSSREETATTMAPA
jgi:hypothetical protein